MVDFSLKLREPTVTLFSGRTAQIDLTAHMFKLQEQIDKDTSISMSKKYSGDSAIIKHQGVLVFVDIPREYQDYVFSMCTQPKNLRIQARDISIDVRGCRVVSWRGEWNGCSKRYRLTVEFDDFDITR